MPPVVWACHASQYNCVGPPLSDANRRSILFSEDCRELRCVISGEGSVTRLVNSILWLGVKSVAGLGYAPLTTGVSITRGNSGNGALPTREPAHGEDRDNAGR